MAILASTRIRQTGKFSASTRIRQIRRRVAIAYSVPKCAKWVSRPQSVSIKQLNFHFYIK
jgi:hypothetical protein